VKLFRLSGDKKPATVSDSAYSLDRMREATIKMRVPVVLHHLATRSS
jgi:hypothetical protein